MKYNEKYDLYLDDDYVIYYWSKKKDKLMQKSIIKNKDGYLCTNTKIGFNAVHRIIYETFVGPIPDGYEIDHINAIRDDNRLENLRCVTHKQNCNNPITLKKKGEAMKIVLIGNKRAVGNTNTKGKARSEFGMKFKEHYGITKYQNSNLYHKERAWFQYHGKCSWE